MEHDLMQKIVSLCKRRGFIFPGSELYGGFANSWDYGPLGVQLKKNIKDEWWKRFVESRSDMFGIDPAVIMNPKVWEASGHTATFNDPLVECKNCHARFRADKIDLKAPCEQCDQKGTFTEVKMFSQMLKTFLGPVEDSAAVAYLRPEIAQAMFVDYQNVMQTMRPSLPFGIAAQGRAFRNEITPGNFIFRTREFDLMEFEYFIRPEAWEEQFTYWQEQMRQWLVHLGVNLEHIHEVEIPEQDRAFYSKRTIDFEYDYPFGQQELYGLAYRTDYDLRRHQEKSGKDLGEIPHVIEPSFGLDRTVLVALLEAYSEDVVEDETRVVLRFPTWMAPVQVAVLPLSKKEELSGPAQAIALDLRKHFRVDYDETQSIGKRYRRQDEIGTPLCVTVDFETLTDQAVTVRDRDTMQQERIAIKDLVKYLVDKTQ